MHSFWTKPAQWGGGIDITQIPEFWENENLSTDPAKIQQVDELLLKIVFFKSMLENETL